MSKIRWGVLGCAGIAKRAVIPGIQQSKTGVVAAIASRELKKAEAAAVEMKIDQAYGSYEALLADPDIDAVYIPLPNHLHKEWTIKAAEAGKHVLCEKPAALDEAEAAAMTTACEAAGVLFAEAFMYRYHPRYEAMKAVIEQGDIGEIRILHGTFMFNNEDGHGNVRFRKAWGGGSLYDVGVYPISAARLLTGQEPEAATVHARFSPDHDDVDMVASGLLEFPDGVALTFQCGMGAYFQNELVVTGTKGRIVMPSAFVTQDRDTDGFWLETEAGRRYVEVSDVNQYALQADTIGRAVLNGDALPFTGTDAVFNMRVLDACLASAETRSRVKVEGS